MLTCENCQQEAKPDQIDFETKFCLPCYLSFLKSMAESSKANTERMETDIRDLERELFDKKQELANA